MKFGQRIPVLNTRRRFIKSTPDAKFWARLCKTVATNGLVVPLNDISDRSRLDTYLSKDPNSDWYTSVYYYPPSAKSYYDQNNYSLKGYAGEAYSNKLIFDFDSEKIEEAKKDALELLYRLSDKGVNIESDVNVYFSGCKGFHIELTTIDQFTPEELKTICSNLANGLSTFDPVVYNTTRLIRIPNTRHQSTGAYKIPLEPIDLQQLTVDQIIERASNPGVLKPANVIQNTEFLNEFKKKNTPAQSVAVDVEEVEGIRGINTIDWSTMPKNMPRCFYALEHGIMVPGQGERNHLFLRLAAYYRNQGYNKEKAYNSLKATARLNAKLYPEAKPYDKTELWNTVISSVYSNGPGWKPVAGASGVDPNNVLIKKYCDALDEHTNCKCSLHATKSATQTLMKIDEVADGFQKFAEDFDNNLVYTGIKFIDDHMKIARGTTTLLAGVSGSGKTTAALNMIERANALGQHVVFFSMDMYKNLVYLKIAQKLTPYSQDEIINFYRSKNQAKVKEIRDLIGKVYDKTHFEFSSTLRIEEVRDTVLRIEESTGNKISLVVVDYAGRLGGPHSDKYANASYNALKSKEVAEQTNAAWIFLVQVARASGDGCTPLRSKRVAKESSDWEDSATNIITMWRPFLGDPDRDDIVRMFLAKNRMGSEIESPLRWDGAKGLIRDLDDLELEDYNTMRGSKEEKEYLKARQSKGLL
ncbi:MAG TPA: DnaB-like helicase C-terminal domain-containing protein [Bacteroidia bacterium]